MNEFEQNTDNQGIYKDKRLANLLPHQFKKGQSGNPAGRPKGSKSLKEYAREMLASMTDDERQEFMEGLPKETIWKMAEGNAETKTDVTSGGDKIVVMPLELINKNESNESPK